MLNDYNEDLKEFMNRKIIIMIAKMSFRSR